MLAMIFKQLISWSGQHFHHLPWRVHRSLYSTLVSEVMLQQTTVSTVKNHFEGFLQRFPDLSSLARATEEELLMAWKGLGYYRRARSLKRIAEAIIDQFQGQFPAEVETLQQVTGIGPYTANALVAIGMNRPALAVDANLERVIARFYGLSESKGSKLQKLIQHLFVEKKIFPDRNVSFRLLNEALMDLGRTYCQARKASCELCPLRTECLAFKNGSPLAYPLEANSKTKKVEYELDLLRFFVLKKNHLLVYQKKTHEWLSGQHEVPTFTLRSTDKNLKQYPNLKWKDRNFHGEYKTGITKYKIKNLMVVQTEAEFQSLGITGDFTWIELNERANLSTATLKGLKLLQRNISLRERGSIVERRKDGCS